MKPVKPGTVPVTGMIADLPTPLQRLFGTVDDDCEWYARALRAWLLALLRLAVTGDRADRLEVMAIARALDNLGISASAMQASNDRAASDQALSEPVFHFFHATSTELCRAIADPTQPGRGDVLRRHIARIEDWRLKRTFAAAVDLEPSVPKPVASRPPLASFGSGARSARHR